MVSTVGGLEVDSCAVAVLVDDRDMAEGMVK